MSTLPCIYHFLTQRVVVMFLVVLSMLHKLVNRNWRCSKNLNLLYILRNAPGYTFIGNETGQQISWYKFLLVRKWQKIDTYSNKLYLLPFVSKPLQKVSVRNILHDQHDGLRPNPKTEYAKNVSMRSNVLHEVNFLKKLSFFLLSSIF